LSDKDLLPEQHRKINGDKEYFIELDNSYVLEVKGFNYLTIRLGMFFDGTTNNTYSAEWGKKILDDYSSDWVDKFHRQRSKDPQEFTDDLFEFPSEDIRHGFDNVVTGSAANEITNVEKLKLLYMYDEIVDNTYLERIYVTGIGTGNEIDVSKPAEEPMLRGVLMGQAFGIGPYGITNKVTTAIESIGSNLESYLYKANNYSNVSYDGIGKFEFDVFGFSRGSAAARHFINLVLDGENGEFSTHIQKVCADEGIHLDPEFKWIETERDKLIVKFVGLFDTVASVLDMTEGDWDINNADTGAARLWLDPAGVEKAVHFTAHKNTEYRKNFCSNKLNLDGLTYSNQFEEHALPGAHSDLGGGYHSISSYQDKSFHLPLLENKLVFKKVWQFKKDIFNEEYSDEPLHRLLDKEIERLNINGWGDIYTREIARSVDPTNLNPHSVGKLFVKRAVKGDLSRLYLQVMYGLASKHNVPLTNETRMWKTPNHLITGEFQFEGDTLDQIAEEALSDALEGRVSNVLKSDKFREALVKQSFVHHSANLGLANVANDSLERVIFECQKGS